MPPSRSGASRANPPSPSKSSNRNPSNLSRVNDNSFSNNVTDDSPDDLSANRRVDTQLVNACFSALASWGLDASIDQLYTDKLGMQKPRNGVCIGMRG